MGSFFPVPKVPNFIQSEPAQPAPSFNVPTEQAQPVSQINTPLSATTAEPIQDNAQNDGETISEEERQNLLTRSRRGRASTVRTSLRGLLQQNEKVAARKSLLGE